MLWSPRTRGVVRRASDVTVTSASTVENRSASSWTGPCRTSALCNPAAAAPAAAQSNAAAVAVAVARDHHRPSAAALSAVSASAPAPMPPSASASASASASEEGLPAEAPAAPLRRTRVAAAPDMARSTMAAPTQRITPTVVHRPGALSASAAPAQAAMAGGTRRRSAGPSCRGSEAPSRLPDAAWTSRWLMAPPMVGGRRTCGHRSRSPHAVHRWTGNRRAVCGSRRCAGPEPGRHPAACPTVRRSRC